MMWAFLTHALPDSVRVTAIGDVEYREKDTKPVDWDNCAVAIVDVMMPVVDGREILGHLRDNHPTTYRVAWTAAMNFTEELIEEGLAHEVVQKPGLESLRTILTARL